MVKWCLRISFALLLFWTCGQFTDAVSQWLFTVLPMLDAVITPVLVILSAVVSWYLGGWLCQKAIDWDRAHGGEVQNQPPQN